MVFCRCRAHVCALMLAAAALHGPSAAGQETDFTFRRVAPPLAGAKRLITIQVDLRTAVQPDRDALPESTGDQGHDLLVTPAPNPTGAIAKTHDQFWALLSPISGPERLGRAARLVEPEEGTRVALQRLGRRFGVEVAAATRGSGVSPALALAVMMVESGGRSDAVSPAGAAGLMQLMPATAERFGVRDRFDPAQSLQGGIAYLDWLLREFGGDALLALAGYNAGEQAVRRYGGVPPYAETLAYVPKVVAAWRAAAELCTTRQVSAADDCSLDTAALASR